MIKQIRLPLHGRPILLITSMITDRIGLHSVLLPLFMVTGGNEVAVDLALVQPFLLYYVYHVILRLTPLKKEEGLYQNKVNLSLAIPLGR